MKTGPLRTFAAACAIALVASGAGGCAARKSIARDVGVTKSFRQDFGFTGRTVAWDLGQAKPVQIAAGASRLMGEFLVLFEAPNLVTVLDRAHLEPTWVYAGLPGPLRYPPVLTATSMLLMAGNQIHEVDLRYGHIRGTPIHFDLAPSAPFTATVGTAFCPSWGGSRGERTIRSVNLVTGFEGWGYRTPGDIRGGVAIGGESPRQHVYLATDAGLVFCLPASGADSRGSDAIWSRQTHGPVTADLALSGEDLFVASQDGFLYCMDRLTGNVKWASPHEVPLMAGPVATKSSVYQVHGKEIWCHDRATGKPRWKLPGGLRFVVEREGRSIVEGTGGELLAVDAKGEVTGRTPTGGLFFPTNVDDGSLFAVGNDGFVYKLEVGGE